MNNELKVDDFGEDFLWGIAIAAAQNEGAYNLNGRGFSIWDQFSRRSGKIKGNAKPDVCCDFYHRFASDLLLAKNMGFKNLGFLFHGVGYCQMELEQLIRQEFYFIIR
jgi:beta-glucosidase